MSGKALSKLVSQTLIVMGLVRKENIFYNYTEIAIRLE